MPHPITQMFGGEDRQFRVLLGELRAIQDRCDAGPPVVGERLARCVQVLKASPKASLLELLTAGLGDWRVDDVREPILQGLMGAGMSPNDAAKLVRKYIDDRGLQGLMENAELALLCVAAGFQDSEDDPASGELEAGEMPSRTSPAES